MAVLVTSAQEALESNEWATRKAAADMLACVATGLGSSLTTFKSSCCASLEACRFDKVLQFCWFMCHICNVLMMSEKFFF